MLIVLAVLARLVYVFFLCPYTLVEDEAHYWEWSRHLEWSYYTKGPGVALTIAASVRFLGALGVPLSEGVVRAPAALASGVLAWALSRLARDVTRDGRIAFLAAAITILAPGLHITSLLMTIDGPYAACWGVAAWCAWRALRGGSGWAWIGLGVAMALGFLYKYTILLLVPGPLIFALAHREVLHLHARWRGLAFLSLAIALTGFAPVIVWNANHDWGTVHHLLGHLGVKGGDVEVATQGGPSYKPAWTLTLIGAQLGLLGPAMLLAIGAARRAFVATSGCAMDSIQRPRPELARADLIFLLACSIPIFAFYLVVSFIAEPEGNWPLAGHLTLIPIAACGALWGVERVRARRRMWRDAGKQGPRPQTLTNVAWRLTLWCGVLMIVASARLDWMAGSAPARALANMLASAKITEPGRPLLPIGRITSADKIALEADGVMKELAARTGQTPFIIGQQYGRASLLAFYMPGRPVVYCSSSKSEGRRTQYDLWAQTNLDDPGLMGRPAVLVGGRLDQWEPAFERIEPIGALPSETKRGRLTWLGFGYKGFPRAKGTTP